MKRPITVPRSRNFHEERVREGLVLHQKYKDGTNVRIPFEVVHAQMNQVLGMFDTLDPRVRAFLRETPFGLGQDVLKAVKAMHDSGVPVDRQLAFLRNSDEMTRLRQQRRRV